MVTLFLVIAVLLTALNAGVYFAFSSAVMPGLRGIDDYSFVVTMRAINQAVFNPWFMTSFFGSKGITAIVAGMALLTAESGRWWILAALGFHLVSLLITVGANIPHNNRLDAAGNSDAAMRKRFAQPWLRWNTARTAAASAALVCLLVPLIQI